MAYNMTFIKITKLNIVFICHLLAMKKYSIYSIQIKISTKPNTYLIIFL